MHPRFEILYICVYVSNIIANFIIIISFAPILAKCLLYLEIV